MVTTFLAALNAGAGFAGYTDWRVPNVRELQAIINFGPPSPATYGAFDAGCSVGCTVTTCSCTQPYYYWSSTSGELIPSNGWFVNVSNGVAGGSLKTTLYFIRAVRVGA